MKIFIFAETKHSNFEQKSLVKVKCADRNYQQDKNWL